MIDAPEGRDALVKTGSEVVGSTPVEFAAFLRAGISKWARVIREGGTPKID